MEMTTNLWLDDVRPCPFVGWIWAKNYQEAVEVMTKYTVIQAQLDHDLSAEHYLPATHAGQFVEKTGYDFVMWMEQNNCWPIQPPIVHSWNPVGARRMAQVIANHYGCRAEKLLVPYKNHNI